jgi:hypothetical protein
MGLRLRAIVRTSTGETTHAFGRIIGQAPVEVQKIPPPASVEILEQDNAFYLLYLDAQGNCLTDTWHDTLDAAKRQAEFEFKISSGDWEPL